MYVSKDEKDWDRHILTGLFVYCVSLSDVTANLHFLVVRSRWSSSYGCKPAYTQGSFCFRCWTSQTHCSKPWRMQRNVCSERNKRWYLIMIAMQKKQHMKLVTRCGFSPVKWSRGSFGNCSIVGMAPTGLSRNSPLFIFACAPPHHHHHHSTCQ